MKWLKTSEKHGNGKFESITESYRYELYLEFPQKGWNEKKESPVLEIYYYHKKNETGWWLDKEKTKWYTCEPVKKIEIKFYHIQRLPKIEKYISKSNPEYEKYTIDYCKEIAINELKEKLMNVVKQLK